MRRLLVGGVAAVAVLFGVSVAVILGVTGDGPEPSRTRPPGTMAPRPLPTPSPAGGSAEGVSPVPLPAPLSAMPRSVPLPPSEVIEAPPPPPPGSWEAVPVAARGRYLGRSGASLKAQLRELQPEISACFDEDVQARHGPSGVVEAAPRDQVEGEGSRPVLILQIETSVGEMRIVDAPVRSRGTAGDGLIACAQRVLRGRTFAASVSRPGERIRLLYPLYP